MTTNGSDSKGSWAKRNVKIIPSLIIGTGGTGISVIRHLKRRVRLDWPGVFAGDMPELIQFYGIDSVSYANRPDQEFLRPSEYGFMGGFDPQELIDPRGPYQSIQDWWKFRQGMLPPGVIHLGARQIRALGRLALFYAFPEVWQKIQYKIDVLNNISAGTQATRYGYDIPIETSARQVFVVSSICGGTGAGCFLDVAARIRIKETTKLKIIGIFVLPSAFEHLLPSRRQVERTRANAYASLKELDALWYADKLNPYQALYPGESAPRKLEHALFDEIYLIGRDGRGRSLTTLNDVTQQIAHFLYLTTINNMADPVGERTVNFDRTTKYYSSFAVGALALPERKLSDSLLAELNIRYLLNLVLDGRNISEEQTLYDAIADYVEKFEAIATRESTNLIGKGAEAFNNHVKPFQEGLVFDLLRWLFKEIVPTYGLGAILDVKQELRAKYEALQDEMADIEDDIADIEDDIDAAETGKDRRNIFNRLGRFGGLLSSLSGRKTIEQYEREIEEYEDEIEENEKELAILRLLVPDDNDKNKTRSGKRLLSYMFDVLKTLEQQVKRFRSQAQKIASELNKEQEEALQRASDVPSQRGEGREYRYYDMEVDPSLKGDNNAFKSLWNQVTYYDHLHEFVSAHRVLRAEPTTAKDQVIPPPTLQLLGLYDRRHGTRRTGQLTSIPEVSRFVNRNANYALNVIEREDWEIRSMIEALVEAIVEETLRKEAGLIQFFSQPLYENPTRRREMLYGLKAMVKNLMDNVKPFWGVKPFPDERQLERVRFICLADDPKTNEIMRDLFREYVDNQTYQFVEGGDPYRLDALFIEHAAELKHIGELALCERAYQAFKDRGEAESLHLHPNYMNFRDLFERW